MQFAGAYGERGTRHTMRVAAGQRQLLGRQVVKSPTASVAIPELQFEIPPLTQKGVITTIEGLITEATAGLRRAGPPGSPPSAPTLLCRAVRWGVGARASFWHLHGRAGVLGRTGWVSSTECL